MFAFFAQQFSVPVIFKYAPLHISKRILFGATYSILYVIKSKLFIIFSLINHFIIKTFLVVFLFLIKLVVFIQMKEFEIMIPSKNYIQKERCTGSEIHQVTIAIKQMHESELEVEVLKRSTPGNPLYQHWMTPDELAYYKQNEVGSNAVVEWLKENNVQIQSMTRYKDYIKASTSISNWEHMLNTTFYIYESIQAVHIDESSNNNGSNTNTNMHHTIGHSQRLNTILNKVIRAPSYTLPDNMLPHISTIMDVVQLPSVITKHVTHKKLLPGTTAHSTV